MLIKNNNLLQFNHKNVFKFKNNNCTKLNKWKISQYNG